ncbi:hypothetical protein GCM10007916_22990 [Psychromonas marina]|uniref:PNPLA domain-containing protein n=1 Tax=Psychromonas marina TaxID=88364 RepID=A0ABQ6E210_9GAMM|nr:alpha/beta fold hydrolase [Psychromonas marina]GLS91230.1 hypothetical protein GCM10007916_22990 [Psychromonas marina]
MKKIGTRYKISQKDHDFFDVACQKVDKIALVTEGGGQRGVFTAGVLDAFLQADFNPFELLIGTSAGSLNLASYICGRQGHAYKMIAEATRQPEFFKLSKYLLSGQGLDLEWLVNNAEHVNPLDWKHGAQQLKNKELIAVATNAKDLSAEYFNLSVKNWKGPLAASCAIPGLHKNPVIFDETRWLDGGVADPIPVEEAYRRGYRHIVVIRTLPSDFEEHHPVIESLLKHSPNKKMVELSAILHTHEENYQRTQAFLNSPPEDLHIYEIFPNHSLKSNAIGSTKKQLDRDYHQGLALGKLFVQTMAKKLQIDFTPFTHFPIKTTERYLALPTTEESVWDKRVNKSIEGVKGVSLTWINVNPHQHKDIVVVVQGRDESSWKYREVIEELAHYFNVFTYDHRGQGESGRMTDLHELGHVDHFQDYVDDLALFMEEVVNPNLQGRCFILAHSMGATVTTHYLHQAEHKVDACVLTSPMFAIKLPKAVGGIKKSTIKMSSKLQKKPHFALTHHAFVKNQFVGNNRTTSRVRFETYSQVLTTLPQLRLAGASSKWITESMAAALKCASYASKISCPILIFQAGSDSIVSNDAQDVFNEHCRSARITHISNAQHDILIESDRYREAALKSIFNFFLDSHQYY